MEQQNDQYHDSNIWNNFLVNLTTYRAIKNFRMNRHYTNQTQLNVHDVQTYSTTGGDNNSFKEKQELQLRKNIRLMIYDLKQTTLTHAIDGTKGKSYGQRFRKSTLNNSMMVDSNNRFRKSWGNFVNLYDDQGRQKLFISLRQLKNYLILNNYNDIDSPFLVYASLFPNGNYPKPLYSDSRTSWRMRFNIFTSGIISEEQGSEDTILHLGELHLYFHVEPYKPEPLYQNLCFFYDQSLNRLIDDGNNLSPKYQRRSLIECARHLRRELSSSLFIEQLLFPIERKRFQSADQTVDYFELKQQDLAAAIMIVNFCETSDNCGGLHSFLYRPKKKGTVEK